MSQFPIVNIYLVISNGISAVDQAATTNANGFSFQALQSASASNDHLHTHNIDSARSPQGSNGFSWRPFFLTVNFFRPTYKCLFCFILVRMHPLRRRQRCTRAAANGLRATRQGVLIITCTVLPTYIT